MSRRPPDCQPIVFGRWDEFFLGVVHSRVHEVWARVKGTHVRERESGFRYTPPTWFETFPFPPAPEEHRAVIAAAAAARHGHGHHRLPSAREYVFPAHSEDARAFGVV
jgi:hypothetical protein